MERGTMTAGWDGSERGRRRRRVVPFLAAAFAASALAAPAFAEPADGGFVVPRPRPALGAADPLATTPAPQTAVPYAPATTAETGRPAGQEVPLYLVAKLTEEGEPIGSGMTWRVFRAMPDETGKLPLVGTAVGGDAEFRLKPGSYFVHAAFGKAGSTLRVDLASEVVSETVVMNAGGLKLDAVVDEDTPIDPAEVEFDVLANVAGERVPVAEKIDARTILRVGAGTYQVVSRYGGVNAVLRADIEVQPGKLTEATLHHQAAEVTLKLVAEPGGEALANTHWSVLSPGGDMVVEGIGAFPSFVLAEGEYAVVAKNANNVYNDVFHVEAGRDRDVEVIAKDDRVPAVLEP
jgi:hypothetical protein